MKKDKFVLEFRTIFFVSLLANQIRDFTHMTDRWFFIGSHLNELCDP